MDIQGELRQEPISVTVGIDRRYPTAHLVPDFRAHLIRPQVDVHLIGFRRF
jgi:hypothetical protein